MRIKNKKEIAVIFIVMFSVSFIVANKIQAASCASGETSECINQEYPVQNAQDATGLAKNDALCTSRSDSSYSYYSIFTGTNCPARQFLCCGKPISSSSSSSSSSSTNPCAGKNNGDSCTLNGQAGTCAVWPDGTSACDTPSNETMAVPCGPNQSCSTGDSCDNAGYCVPTNDLGVANSFSNAQITNTPVSCSSDSDCPSSGDSCISGHCMVNTDASSNSTNPTSGYPTPAPATQNSASPSTSSSQNNTTPSAYNYANGIYIPQMGLPGSTVQSVLMNLLQWLLGVVGIIALISFVISGIQYFVAAGDETRMQSAKRTMVYSIIGVVVVSASYVIIQAINFALQAKTIF